MINSKCKKGSGSKKNHPIFTKFGVKSHIYDIDLHPKNQKIPIENLLPERAQAELQEIEITRAHSTGYSS